MNEIKNPKFFTAGHALFTVSNPNGEHYTFRIGHSREDQPLFVGLLTGPNNESDYTYMGIYNPEDPRRVILTRASKYSEETTPVKVVRWAIAQVSKGNELPNGYSIQHEGKCCRCGRTLTDPESISLGIGPVCRDQSW